MIGFVYCLSQRGNIFYVGATINFLNRLPSHIAQSKINYPWKTPVAKYIKKYNISPSIHLLEIVQYRNKKKLWTTERKWVQVFASQECSLLNVAHNRPFSKKAKIGV